LKDLNNFLTLQLVYNQMWLNCFMDDYHFSNITKNKLKTLYLIILEKMDIFLYNGNNIVKNLMISLLNSQRL
jgi:hypothetical protein